MRDLPQHYLRAGVLRTYQSISELLEKQLYQMSQEGKTKTLSFSGQIWQYVSALLDQGQWVLFKDKCWHWLSSGHLWGEVGESEVEARVSLLSKASFEHHDVSHRWQFTSGTPVLVPLEQGCLSPDAGSQMELRKNKQTNKTHMSTPGRARIFCINTVLRVFTRTLLLKTSK